MHHNLGLSLANLLYMAKLPATPTPTPTLNSHLKFERQVKKVKVAPFLLSLIRRSMIITRPKLATMDALLEAMGQSGTGQSHSHYDVEGLTAARHSDCHVSV